MRRSEVCIECYQEESNRLHEIEKHIARSFLLTGGSLGGGKK